jgi:hypothetical protein
MPGRIAGFAFRLASEGNTQQLLEGTFMALQRYAQYFSTAVGRFGAPRGITVVITGSLAQTFTSNTAAGA